MDNNDILFISSKDEELYNMEDLLDSVNTKRPKTVSIVDAENPEDSQMYTYNKFLEIFDSNGLNGFVV